MAFWLLLYKTPHNLVYMQMCEVDVAADVSVVGVSYNKSRTVVTVAADDAPPGEGVVDC